MRTLTPEEFKKLYGEAGLKSVQDVSKKPTESVQPGFIDRVSNVVSTAGKDVYNKITTPTDGSVLGNIKAGTEATATAFNAIPQVAVQALPEFARTGLSKLGEFISSGIQAGANKIADIPQLQSFVTQHPEATKALEDILGTSSAAGQISGDILATNQVAKTTQNVVDTGIKAVNNVAEQGKSAYDALSGKLPNITSYPKQFLDKITTDKISPQVKTILQDAPVEKLDRYIADGVKAQSDPRALTPLEKAGETAVSTAKIIKSDLGNLGRQKVATLDSVGNVKVPGVAIEQIDKIKTLLQKNLTKDERGFVNSYIKELEVLGKNPAAKTVDALVDKMQSTFFEKGGLTAIPVTTRIKSLINTSIGEINSKLKSVVDGALGSKDYSILNQQYANKVKLFGALNKSLGAEGARGSSLLKRFFSPQDAGTKKLFGYIKQYYGIDLAQDATLAKFVMETLGDTRAKSLLQLPPMSKSGIIDRALQAVENKLTSPTKVLDKARTMAQKKTTL